MLEDDALDDVRDVLAAIARVLEVLVDLFPLDDDNRILLFLEQPGDLQSVAGEQVKVPEVGSQTGVLAGHSQRVHGPPHLARPGDENRA